MNRTSHLFLLRELVRRDFAARYAGSMLGMTWSFIQPLWQLALLSFVFSLIMRLRLDGEATERFWVFLLCGLLPWTAIQEAVQRSATVITDHAEMVKKIAFPSELLVVNVTVSSLIHQAITMSLFLVALIWVGELDVRLLALLPVAMLAQVVLTLGLSYLVAALNVFFRDTSQFLGMIMSAWFYTTPIVYPLAMAADYQDLVTLNPLTILVMLYRRVFLGPESPWVDSVAPLVAIPILFLILGLGLFRHLKPTFSDEI